MGNRVRGHHELKSVNARQKVVMDVRWPTAFLSLFEKSLVNKANDCANECASADRRIEHLDFVPSVWQLRCVREAVRKAEIRFEYMIDGANDKAHDRKRGVVCAHFLAQFRVVLFQEVFVEVNDGVLSLRSAVFLEIFLH